MRRYFIYREKTDNPGIGFLAVAQGFDTVKQAKKKQALLETVTTYSYHFLVQDEPAPKKVSLRGENDVQITELGSS